MLIRVVYFLLVEALEWLVADGGFTFDGTNSVTFLFIGNK